MGDGGWQWMGILSLGLNKWRMLRSGLGGHGSGSGLPHIIAAALSWQLGDGWVHTRSEARPTVTSADGWRALDDN